VGAQAGLLLALLGGVRKGVAERDSVPVRGDIHVLVCGDPGLGKSQLLQAPRSTLLHVPCMHFDKGMPQRISQPLTNSSKHQGAAVLVSTASPCARGSLEACAGRRRRRPRPRRAGCTCAARRPARRGSRWRWCATR